MSYYCESYHGVQENDNSFFQVIIIEETILLLNVKRTTFVVAPILVPFSRKQTNFFVINIETFKKLK